MEFGEKIFQQEGHQKERNMHHLYPAWGLDSLKMILFSHLKSSNPSFRIIRTGSGNKFIDDIIAVMQGTREDSDIFTNWMNTLWPGIEFTFEWSDTELTNLDVHLIMTDGRLETDRHLKPTYP